MVNPEWMLMAGCFLFFRWCIHGKSRLRHFWVSHGIPLVAEVQNFPSTGDEWSCPIDPILGVSGVPTKDERRWQRTMGRYQGAPENAAPAPGSAGRWWNLRSSAFLRQDWVGFQRIFLGCSSHFTVVFTYFRWDSIMSMVVQSETWEPIGP